MATMANTEIMFSADDIDVCDNNLGLIMLIIITHAFPDLKHCPYRLLLVLQKLLLNNTANHRQKINIEFKRRLKILIMSGTVSFASIREFIKIAPMIQDALPNQSFCFPRYISRKTIEHNSITENNNGSSHSFSQSHRWFNQRSYYQKLGIKAWQKEKNNIPFHISSNCLFAKQLGLNILSYAQDLNLKKLTIIDFGAGHGLLSYHLANFFLTMVLEKRRKSNRKQKKSMETHPKLVQSTKATIINNDDDEDENDYEVKEDDILNNIQIVLSDFNQDLITSHMNDSNSLFHELKLMGLIEFAIIDALDKNSANKPIQLLYSNKQVEGPLVLVMSYFIDSLPCDILRTFHPTPKNDKTENVENNFNNDVNDITHDNHNLNENSDLSTSQIYEMKEILTPLTSSKQRKRKRSVTSTHSSSSSSLNKEGPHKRNHNERNCKRNEETDQNFNHSKARFVCEEVDLGSYTEDQLAILKLILNQRSYGNHIIPWFLIFIMKRMRLVAKEAPIMLVVSDSPFMYDDPEINTNYYANVNTGDDAPGDIDDAGGGGGDDDNNERGWLLPEISPCSSSLAVPVDFDVCAAIFQVHGGLASATSRLLRFGSSTLLSPSFTTSIMVEAQRISSPESSSSFSVFSKLKDSVKKTYLRFDSASLEETISLLQHSKSLRESLSLSQIYLLLDECGHDFSVFYLLMWCISRKLNEPVSSISSLPSSSLLSTTNDMESNQTVILDQKALTILLTCIGNNDSLISKSPDPPRLIRINILRFLYSIQQYHLIYLIHMRSMTKDVKPTMTKASSNLQSKIRYLTDSHLYTQLIQTIVNGFIKLSECKPSYIGHEHFLVACLPDISNDDIEFHTRLCLHHQPSHRRALKLRKNTGFD